MYMYLTKLFNSINVLARANRAFSAAAVLPLCGTRCVNLSTAVGLVLNATIACQKITSNTVILVLQLLPEFCPH